MTDISELSVSRIEHEADIDASLETTWVALLDQIGPGFVGPKGEQMSFVLEAWPGGRWYRDLGNNTGHLWGHVQVIKPPKLLEIVGPMFMSYPVSSHMQYRLTEKGSGTHLQFVHRAFGAITAEHRSGMWEGWGQIFDAIKGRAIR